MFLEFHLTTTSTMSNFQKKFQFLIHSIHDTNALETIFTKNRIKLKGNNSNKDYFGLPFIWFGVFIQNLTNTSRYGAVGFKINIEKVLAKGSKYFGLGKRKYKLEHSHTIMITDRELIHGFDTNFPTVDIQDNQLIKQIDNEWRLNND